MHDPHGLQDKDIADLDFLLTIAARKILAGAGFAGLLAWLRQSGASLAPGLAAAVEGGEAGQRGFFHLFARAIWNHTPHPANRYRPLPLPKPERNAPCPCGSGARYKQCCGHFEGSGPDLSGFSMLGYVLDALPRSQHTALPYDQISLEELAFVARGWIERGRARDAVHILEPLFADMSQRDARAETAADTLLDAYLALDKPRKRKQFIERLLVAPDRRLRSTGLQRACAMAADAGDHAQAAALFREAQTLEPDNPSLSHLEILILVSAGDKAQAVERAKFWIARLRRERDADYGGLIDYLERVVADIDGAMLETSSQGSPAIAAVQALIARLPAPQNHYRLAPHEGEAGPLKPGKTLLSVQRKWSAVFPGGKPDLTHFGANLPDVWHDPAPWLELLGREPLAWQSFDILDDLVLALHDYGSDLPGVDTRLLQPLLEHAAALLRAVLAASSAERCTLAWGWLENRPALRLLANLIQFHLDRKAEAAALPLLEWLVLQLNPHDNHGFRETLCRLYLQAGRHADALALSERYPDDFAAMQYARALALYRAGRRGEALAALAAARDAYPQVLRMLVAENPRRPALNAGYITRGGADEAWLYRQAWRALWAEGGALDWARPVARLRGRRG